MKATILRAGVDVVLLCNGKILQAVKSATCAGCVFDGKKKGRGICKNTDLPCWDRINMCGLKWVEITWEDLEKKSNN